MGVLNIQDRFRKAGGGRNMSTYQLRRDRGHPVLMFANRYLTLDEETASVPADIDPMGILRNCVSNGAHTSDNEVQYYERHEHKDGYVHLITICCFILIHLVVLSPTCLYLQVE